MVNPCCLILGSYVNAYGIVRELAENGVYSIAMIDFVPLNFAAKSKWVSYRSEIPFDPDSLRAEILRVKEFFSSDLVILYPTSDEHLEILKVIFKDIETFSYIPFNETTIPVALDKLYQCQVCLEYSIPVPTTIKVESAHDLGNLAFPILVKPSSRVDIRGNSFRNLFLVDEKSIQSKLDVINKSLDSGISLLGSEYVPGPDRHIYAYTAFRSRNGEVLNSWVGQKLSQCPELLGVFSTCTNGYSAQVKQQGELLISRMNLYGFCEPEFKFDLRDGKFKLMEVNLRSMMWHRLGNLCGVKLHYTQYLDAIGESVPSYVQNVDNKINMVYLKHELINIAKRPSYFKSFLSNLFMAEKLNFPVYNRADLMPLLFDIYYFIKICIKKCLKKFVFSL